MSKSKKNFYRIDEITGKGFDPLALRYLFLTSHYRDRLNFTGQSLQAAQNALDNLRQEIRGWDEPKIGCAGCKQQFMDAVNDDLNMPRALAVVWKLVKSDKPSSAKAKTILEMDKILGLNLDEYIGKSLEIPEDVRKLINQREQVRQSGDFKKSDELRHKIKKLGYEVEDTSSGPKIKSGIVNY